VIAIAVGDLLLQTLLFAGHPVVAHRLVSRGVGFHLGAVQSQPSEFQQSGLMLPVRTIAMLAGLIIALVVSRLTARMFTGNARNSANRR
jgi:hypothetical protein